MPPVPKRKQTKGGSGRRKVALALKMATLAKCPSCGKLKFPHRACPHCGYYK